MDAARIEPRLAAWQGTALSITPLPLGPLTLMIFFQARHRVFSLRRLSERNRNERNLSGSLFPERPGRSGLRIGRERLLVDLRNEKSHLWVRKLQSSLLVGRTYKLSKP